MPAANKAKLIQLINIGKTQCHLLDDGTDDCEYRQLLICHGATRRDGRGKLSANLMTVAQLMGVLRELQGMGFIIKSKTRQHTTGDDKAMLIAKLETMWSVLHEHSVVRSPSRNALRAYCKRVTGADALEMAEEHKLHDCIEALKDMARRNGITVSYDFKRNSSIMRK